MTIAIKLEQAQPAPSSNLLLKPVQFGGALVKRLWWHTEAYATIVGLMVLVLLSLVVLQAHRLYCQLAEASEPSVREAE